MVILAGCSSASKEQRNRAALHAQIGTGYLTKGQYPQAMAELLKAEQLDPKNPATLNNLGLVYYVRGRKPQAESKFRKAIEQDSKFSDAKNNLARVLMDQGHFQEALKWLHQVENDLTYPHPDKALANLGVAYFELGDFKKAEGYLERALDIQRDSCMTTQYLGRALFELKRVRQSAEVLDQAIERCRAEKVEDPLFYSATSYFQLGEKEKARARVEELLKEYPQSKYVAKSKGMLELLSQ